MARNPVRSFREFMAFLKSDPGMPYAEYPFRPNAAVRKDRTE
jgi:hypothetical protein